MRTGRPIPLLTLTRAEREDRSSGGAARAADPRTSCRLESIPPVSRESRRDNEKRARKVIPPLRDGKE
jgi:hypothetical protein